MLHHILRSAGLTPQQCAAALGIGSAVFEEWASGQSPIPQSFVPLLSTVLGIRPADLLSPVKHLRGDVDDLAPAIWFKLRASELRDRDREFVLVVRQLGHYMNQLEAATESPSLGWKNLFEDLREHTDLQAPPREQGRQSARMFRKATGLDKGAVGVGDVLRGHLRSKGLLVVETPLPESVLEGCTFYVGSGGNQRPCVFANSFRSSWFRRNVVLLHEVAHAIFDAEADGAALDYVEGNGAVGDDLKEARASAFAREVLIPPEVLRHVSQRRGLRWTEVSDSDLAHLVADTHVELRTILAVAVETGLLDESKATGLVGREIGRSLKEISNHALSTEEYIKGVGLDKATWLGRRTTTIPSPKLVLPVPYVSSVLEAVGRLDISASKAAELLMIEEADFESRFKDVVTAPMWP